EHLGGDLVLFSRLEEEFERTVRALGRIRRGNRLIADNAVLQSAIALRNPYVDVLSLLQISLLRRKRAAGMKEDEKARVDEALATTLSGIAQGLRNTG
ncbi:MAG: phosphoenolpyruvate carboxylase, partial [Gemmatimonadaceae bacterium]